jgi:schlafen family protein
MSTRAEQLFHQLASDPAAILALVGKSEDLHLECKEWPARDDDAQRVFAKAACGLANAEGGVLLVGMKAKSVSKDEPDLIDSHAPVADASAVKSRILDLVGQLVEPGIEGIHATEVNDSVRAKSGFVVVYVPASEGPPKRSRKDWRFYLRVGSGTFAMDYFQIADMFGRRAHPKLELYLEATGAIKGIPYDPALHRYFWLGLSNVGRGLAKFPSIRFKRVGPLTVDRFGLDGNGHVGLRERPSDGAWITFGGGADDVVYSSTTLKITQLIQRIQADELIGDFFPQFTFTAEISCEGLPTFVAEKSAPPADASGIELGPPKT